MEIVKIVIFILLAIWYFFTMRYNYLDSKKRAPDWSIPEKYRDPGNIFYAGALIYGVLFLLEQFFASFV
jgi:hypothetical protein